MADGVLEKEVAMQRGQDPNQSDARGLHSGYRVVLCKRIHGIVAEVRDTNLRFFTITTTPTNRC